MIRTAFLILTLGVLTAAEPALREPVPAEDLDGIRAQCMAGCGEHNDAATCETLCDCTREQFETQLNLDTYKRLIAEIELGSVSDRNRIFLDKTATFCAARVPDPYNLPAPEK